MVDGISPNKNKNMYLENLSMFRLFRRDRVMRKEWEKVNSELVRVDQFYFRSGGPGLLCHSGFRINWFSQPDWFRTACHGTGYGIVGHHSKHF